MLSRRSMAVAMFFGGVIVACSAQPSAAPSESVGAPVRVAGGTYTNVTPDQLAGMLKSGDFLFVNTHIPYEGEIEQTDAFIAFAESGPQRVGDYPADKDAQVVLYCRSGRMSAIVAEELVKAGYTDVWNLEGGMIAWEQAGHEVLSK